ncbi:hypothetical protein [Streptomyces sp. NPDC020917]|uniref:hypothetical protein n=1 Tax=Streptomyces sp. NPDC020917 TaxID=3365102 RepID=UPI0037A63EE7
MSVIGVWVIGTVSDERVAEVLRAAVESSPPPRPQAANRDVSGPLAWWRDRADASMFSKSATDHGGWVAEGDAYRLNDFLDGCRADSEQVEALRDAVLELFPPEGDEGLFAATARKASPFAALAYALGPDATLQLPGWFGDFLLDSGEVGPRLLAAEEALALTGSRRREVVERIHAWMTGLGDAPGHDAEELLDGPLRVLRRAARTGQGVAGHVRWY